MPDLPVQKIGIVACSGEELAEGTVSRLAALKVLEELRPHEAVTICLPLFLAGGEGDRAFARLHPTITVDGCALRCAAVGTERYSARPAASVVVSELLAEQGLPAPQQRRRLDDAGQRAVAATAQVIVGHMDVIRAARGAQVVSPSSAGPETEAPEPSCSCGSGVPVMRVEVDGRVVEFVALKALFAQLREGGLEPGPGAGERLLAAARVYTEVPPGADAAYATALAREYAARCDREDDR